MREASVLRLMHVVGARPNFMKVAPVMAAVDAWNGSAHGDELRIEQTLVHTGQHYAPELSQVIFDDLGMPEPDEHLAVGSGSHGAQLARLLERLEVTIIDRAPDLVLVPGDVNSTCAAALIASRLGAPVAHLEAGLRSGDRGMPEEVNRVIVDHIAELLLTTCDDGDRNLAVEGIPSARVRLVGNTMVDSLFRLLPRAAARAAATADRHGCADGPFVLVTLHRPSNVDEPPQLRLLLAVLRELSSTVKVLFPMHLRTRERIERLSGREGAAPSGLIVSTPLSYLDFVSLMTMASVVITDSGGVQEETTALGVPCVTIRTTTERPVTLTQGTNRLVDPTDSDMILDTVRDSLARGRPTKTPVIPLWDGHAGPRVVEAIAGWAQSLESPAAGHGATS
jgi:UDP-N-acetylglucosamine 2-epimerase (non-hydrolysing)